MLDWLQYCLQILLNQRLSSQNLETKNGVRFDEHDVIIKEMAEKYSGNYIKSTVYGALLVFDGPKGY